MNKLYITVGLPGSGKSTWAKKQDNCFIIDGDYLREMLHGGKYVFNPIIEPSIYDAMYYLIGRMLRYGDVIFDSLNHTLEHRRRSITMFKKTADLIAIVFPVDKQQNLEWRSTNLRGYTIEKWSDIIDEYITTYEEPALNEGFAKIIYV